MKPFIKKLVVTMLFCPFLLGAELVCTFSGQAEDIVHEIGLKPGTPVTVILPTGEQIERLLYNRDFLAVEKTGREVVINSQKETVDTALCIVTRESGVYRFRLKDDPAALFDNKIIIKK